MSSDLRGLNWVRSGFRTAPDRSPAEECRVAAAWFTMFTVTARATEGGGGTASYAAASFHKPEIVCYVATWAASLPCPMWAAYTL